MPFYQQRGKLPRKRHIAFRREDGSLYPEELVGNKGFAGASSLLYHLRLPTAVKSVAPFRDLVWEAEEPGPLGHRHLRSARVETGSSPVLDRVALLWNEDVALSVVRPSSPEDVLYRNAEADELVYVTEGEGILESAFGDLAFRDGDYLVVPRGIVHRYRLAPRPARFLVIESRGEVRLPKRYRNEHGQLLEGAPFSERDIRTPGEPRAIDQTGDFSILVKSRGRLTELSLAHHPFDVVGWDGYYYPWAFNIHDFEPKVARIHLPPPVHQTFEGDGWVVCSFCPRPYDFDKDAVPAPYNHQNVMSDEVLYYASAQFMSRKGIEVGSITLHPDGLPHGPQPGKAEESIGKTWTDELAVMLDTFRPLRVGRAALGVEDTAYATSWLEGPSA
jgi:homogentisate 1,2-dioxygenase